MSDLLVQRLKAAKRELTALKTAHRRGLGLLRIYEKYTIDIPEIEEGQVLIFVVNFSDQFAPYPFFQFSTAEQGISSNYFFGTADAEYQNNGYSVKITLSFDQGIFAYLKGAYVFSTSPILSINCSVG